MSAEPDKESSELERAIAGLRAQGIDPASIGNLVEGAKALVDLSDADFQAALRNWRNVARTGYYHDFLPILFASLADACQDRARRQRLHGAAKELSLTRVGPATVENLDANDLRCPRCGAEDVDNSRRWTPQSGDSGDWVAFVCRKCGHEESAMGATPAVGFAWERHALGPVEQTPELERSIAGLQAQRIEVSGVIQWAKSIIDVPDVTFEAAMRAWQEEVGTQRYGDFGALLLQSLADACPETKRKQRLQKAAQELAQRRTTRALLPATEEPAPTDVIARIERATQLARAGRHEDALLELEPAVHYAAVRRAVAMLPPRFHTTAQSTGFYRDVAPVPASATVRWVADGIAVDTNTIFLTDFAASPVALLARCGRQKRMVVLDPDTGALRCEWPYADAILHRDEPALLGDVALVLSNPEAGKPDLKARDVGTGELLWSWRPEGSVTLEGLAAGLLIELQEKSVHARPFSDPRVAPGETRQGWSQDRDWFKPVTTSGKDAGVRYAGHVVTEDAVVQYIADDNRGQVLVRALHPQLGSELWRTRIDPEGRAWIGAENQWEHWIDGVTANLVTDRSGLVFGVKDGEWQDGAHVLAFAATGELRWRAWDVGARPIALAAEGVYVTTTRDYPSRTLSLLDRADGARRWEHRLALDSERFLAVRGAFYSLVPPRTLEVRSAADASLIQSVALPLALNVRDSDGYCEVSLAAANGRVFVAAGNKVVCVGEKSERRAHVSYGVPEPEGETAAAESPAVRAAPQSLPQTMPSEQAGNLPRTLEGKGGAVKAVAFSPDGKFLASGSDDKTVRLWDVATGSVIKSLVGHGDWIQVVAFSPDGKILASGSDDKTARIWDVATGKNVATLSGHNDEVMSIEFSPNGKILATGGDDNKVRLWDIGTSQEIRELSGHSGRVNSVSFSPDGKVLASASGDSTVKLWDVATGKEIKTLTVPGQKFNSVAFSPDGTLLASASDDKTIKVWDVASGRQTGTLTGHRLEVRSASFSPDGTMLASGSSDADIKLWQFPTGKEVRTLGGHGAQVNSVSFSPDGRTLASGSKDHTIMLWEVKTEAGEEGTTRAAIL